MTSETLREPLVPLTTAYLLLGLGGVTCAFALFALLGRRYVTEEERHRRSVAIITALVAMLGGCAALAAILPNAKAKTLEPLVMAIPTGLGAYALTAVIIDAVASRRFGRQRARLATGALLSLLTLPAVMGMAAIDIKIKIIVAIIVAVLILTT